MHVQAPKTSRKDRFFRNASWKFTQSERLAVSATAVGKALAKSLPTTTTFDPSERNVSRAQTLRRKKIRRGGKRFNKSHRFCLLGNNVAGLTKKKESLNAIIETFKAPSCITLQETKLGKTVEFKIPNYQVFQNNRNSSGGGLLTAVDSNLNPLIITSESSLAEILTVQLEVNDKKIRLLNAYGPQNDDLIQKRLEFWTELDQEIVSAVSDGCLILIQMDANAKVGRHIITADPNKNPDDNGLELLALIERHNLVMLNADERCIGAITRFRQTKDRKEQSILDYILVCRNLFTNFTSMWIDEERYCPLTNYSSRTETKVASDHNLLSAEFNIKYKKKLYRPQRREIFNFKDKECVENFFIETNNNEDFLQLANMEESSTIKFKRFTKLLDKSFHKCFKKIRIKDQSSVSCIQKSEVQEKLVQRNNLSFSLSSIKCKLAKEITESKIEELDKEVSNLCSHQNAMKINDQTRLLNNDDGTFSQLSMWKLKRSLFSQQSDPPTAKRDASGNLITCPLMLKNLYLNTYRERLCRRDIKTEFEDIFQLKTELWEHVLSEFEKGVTRDWSLNDLERVLQKLKNNKTRDPFDYINEIFKPDTMGLSMKLALLSLFNQIKKDQIIPEPMQYANISSIHKKKGSRQLLENDRGIFVVSALRMILDTLIYQEKFPIVDQNMSPSNIGARRNRNIRDHLFVVYAVVNSVINGHQPCADLQIYDVQKCFDELWLEDCMLDLAYTLPRNMWDDKLALLYKMNSQSFVSVKTPFGLTDRVKLENIVMQGGKWGPLKCSNSMDQIGKKCLLQNKNLYKYKNEVEIPPLAMVDDLITVSTCGIESLDTNIMVNAEIAMKKLRLHTPTQNGTSKCHKIHIGSSKKIRYCDALKIDDFSMEEVTVDTYLGDKISSDGRIDVMVKDRVSKGLGALSNIFDILNKVSLGSHYFTIALTLREALLINGMLYNSEVWNGLGKSYIDQFEGIDNIFFRKLFKVTWSCPIEAFFLETGTIPLGILIKGRRLKYLHHILTRNDSELIFKVFHAQWRSPHRNDWVVQIKDDLSYFGFKLDLSEIKAYSKYQFKNVIKKKTREKAFEELVKKKEMHSKLSNVYYDELKFQGYLRNTNISVHQAQILFKSRCRMTHYWENFKGWKFQKTCPVCNDKSSADSQEHSFSCIVIRKCLKVNGEISDVYCSEISAEVAKTVETIEKFREIYLVEN